MIDYSEGILAMNKLMKDVHKHLLEREFIEAQNKCVEMSILILKLYCQIQSQSGCK